MSEAACTQFEELGRAATSSPAAAALWLRHRETCPACLTQERLDAALRESLRGIRPAAASDRFTAGVVGRLAAAPAPARFAWTIPLLFLYGGFAVAASAWILARMPAPLFDPASVRAVALGGALISPIVLLGGLRRALMRLLCA